MKIVVDTNIVFSAILNSTSNIGNILINSKEHIRFYTCEFLRDELHKHRNKIQALTGLTELEIEELETLVTKNITFINEKLIPSRTISDVKVLLNDIDVGDTPFVGLTAHLRCKLWTGDKKLLSGLKAKGFAEVLTTIELSKLLYDVKCK